MTFGSDDDSDIEVHAFASSNLSSATFNAKTGEAAITFQRGATYTTDEMTPELWDRLKAAPSAGKFFNEHLRELFT